MQRAWTFRRFLLPLAGLVCWAGLTVATELRPPRPPADNDGLTLDERRPSAPQRVSIKPLTPAPVILEPADDEPIDARPIITQPAERGNSSIQPPPDPTPIIEPPMAIYPEMPPPVVYLPGCDGAFAPTCTTGMYCQDNLCNADCGASCGDACCTCSCVPNWTIRAEAIIWDRAGGGGVPLVGAPVLLNSSDLDGGWRVGPRLTAIKHGVLGGCWDLEVAYFGIDGWSATQTLVDADNYLTNPVTNIVGVVPLTATYDSSLHSAEFDARRMYSDWATWFVGFRALEVDELLFANIGGGASTHSIETQNRLYGAQVGLDLRLLDCPCWYVNAVGKAGIYGNSADQVTRTAGIGGALPFITYSGGQTAFVGELGLNAGYRFSDRLTLLAGYNLLWVNGVALAPDQLASTNVATGVGALDASGNLFYHGVNVGVQYGW